MSRTRRWFPWAFLLATLVAAGPHDHRDSAVAGVVGEFGACDDAHSHWAGHDPAAAGPTDDRCAICQHRLLDLMTVPTRTVLGSFDSAALPDLRPAAPAIGASSRQRCRAPPCA